MKTSVVTASFSCDPNKIWLYMTNPNLNHWRTDLKETEISGDGMHATEKCTDGSVIEITYTRKEKPRHLGFQFAHGKVRGEFTAILLGGGDSTSVECTMSADGLGLFEKPAKRLDRYLDMLRKGLGE